MTDYKVPQAYRPDPGQLVMVPDQNTIAQTSSGARMVWVGVIIGGAFIAAACLWGVNALLESSVQEMVRQNRDLDQRVQLARQQVQIFQQRKAFFERQSARLRDFNTRLESETRLPPGSGGRRPTPNAPIRSVPPP